MYINTKKLQLGAVLISRNLRSRNNVENSHELNSMPTPSHIRKVYFLRHWPHICRLISALLVRDIVNWHDVNHQTQFHHRSWQERPQVLSYSFWSQDLQWALNKPPILTSRDFLKWIEIIKLITYDDNFLNVCFHWPIEWGIFVAVISLSGGRMHYEPHMVNRVTWSSF
jgi:hypothetical protein